jgi:ubiquitin carboxyl-terminal hydrolase 4/11/15
MNSILQVLSNTPIWCGYFITQRYLNDINKENILGTKGILAMEYGNLISSMWNNENIVIPKNFKKILSNFATQFTGYNQHGKYFI